MFQFSEGVMNALPPQAQPESTETKRPANPWTSINDMLIQNRCWLCQNVFARGKMKKVFMLSHLLRYCEERYKLEQAKIADPSAPTCRELTTEATAAASTQLDGPSASSDLGGAGTDGMEVNGEEQKRGIMLDMVKELSSKNLSYCYEEFKSFGADQDKLSPRFIEAECETWMSGLICARTPECAMEYLLMVPDGKISSTIMAGESGFQAGSGGQNCDVNCGCDNPWHYISAALLETEA